MMLTQAPQDVQSTILAGLPSCMAFNNGDRLDYNKVGLMQPTPKDAPLEEMRRKLKETGYVFVKNLIPREDVLRVRESYFAKMAEAGMLKPDSNPRDGIFNTSMPPDAAAGIGSVSEDRLDQVTQKCLEAHHAPEYLEFLQHPSLRDFIKQFMQWEQDVLCTRTLLRHSVPNAKSTGIHYDKIFLRVGEADFLTAWVPIGDIAMNGGGLSYLENSSNIGKETEEDFSARAADFPPEERINAFNVNMALGGVITEDALDYTERVGKGRKWLIADYEAGDVVFHDPFMVHTATVNQSEQGIIRLSTDLRFYQKGDDMDERWMKPWFPNDGL
ncbi:hypothetical protein Q7P37_008748 [Cladosporium fusiforme]